MSTRLRPSPAAAATVALALATMSSLTLSAQTAPGRSTPVKSGRTYTPPRTAWGDPDLQGSYTNILSAARAGEAKAP